MFFTFAVYVRKKNVWNTRLSSGVRRWKAGFKPYMVMMGCVCLSAPANNDTLVKMSVMHTKMTNINQMWIVTQKRENEKWTELISALRNEQKSTPVTFSARKKRPVHQILFIHLFSVVLSRSCTDSVSTFEQTSAQDNAPQAGGCALILDRIIAHQTFAVKLRITHLQERNWLQTCAV